MKGKFIKNIIILCVLIAPLLSCATYSDIHKDPRAECVAAQDTFAAVVRGLAAMRAEGVFDDEQIEKIDTLIRDGREILDAWYKNVIDGLPVEPEEKSVFQTIINKLISYKGD